MHAARACDQPKNTFKNLSWKSELRTRNQWSKETSSRKFSFQWCQKGRGPRCGVQAKSIHWSSTEDLSFVQTQPLRHAPNHKTQLDCRGVKDGKRICIGIEDAYSHPFVQRQVWTTQGLMGVICMSVSGILKQVWLTVALGRWLHACVCLLCRYGRSTDM